MKDAHRRSTVNRKFKISFELRTESSNISRSSCSTPRKQSDSCLQCITTRKGAPLRVYAGRKSRRLSDCRSSKEDSSGRRELSWDIICLQMDPRATVISTEISHYFCCRLFIIMFLSPPRTHSSVLEESAMSFVSTTLQCVS